MRKHSGFWRRRTKLFGLFACFRPVDGTRLTLQDGNRRADVGSLVIPRRDGVLRKLKLTMSEQTAIGKRVILFIMLGLTAWGIYHTVGIFRSEDDASKAIVKAAVVFVAMALFLGWWGALLFVFKRRQDKRLRNQDEQDRS